MKLKLLALLAVAASALASFYTLHSRYHLPKNQAELKLNHYLMLGDEVNEKSNQLRNYILKIPDTNHAYDEQFAKLITTEFRNSAADAEAQEVRKNCNGIYDDGYICGIDVSITNCSQDSPEKYIYRSTMISPDTAIIHIRPYTESHRELLSNYFDGSQNDMAIYRLKYTGNTWKVDGMKCGDEGNLSINY